MEIKPQKIKTQINNSREKIYIYHEKSKNRKRFVSYGPKRAFAVFFECFTMAHKKAKLLSYCQEV